jgi:beta-lactam-binding protein with PASTA domain
MSTESPFTITVSSDAVKLQNGKGEVTATVANTSGRALKGRAEILPGKPEAAVWLSVARLPERNFVPGAVEQFVIQLKVPAKSPEGDHTFRLRVVDVADPNERVTVGPAVGFKVPAESISPPPARWWIPVVIGLVVLLLIGGGITFWLLNRKPPAQAEENKVPTVETVEVPEVTNKVLSEAKTTLENKGFVVEVSRRVESKPPDIVLEQKPPARTSASKGATVKLVATHDSMVLVPPLNGKPEGQARAELAGLLEVDRVERNCLNNPAPANSVYESNPRSGDAVARSVRVLLRLKDDCVPVPRLVGAEKGTAFTSLNSQGLLGNPLPGSIDPNRLNIVERQDPNPDVLVPKGSTVNITFYRRPVYSITEFGPLLERQNALKALKAVRQ